MRLAPSSIHEVSQLTGDKLHCSARSSLPKSATPRPGPKPGKTGPALGIPHILHTAANVRHRRVPPIQAGNLQHHIVGNAGDLTESRQPSNVKIIKTEENSGDPANMLQSQLTATCGGYFLAT